MVGYDRATDLLLDIFPLGIVVVDSSGNLLQANRCAHRILRQGNTFNLSTSALFARRVARNHRFQKLLRRVLQSTPSCTGRPDLIVLPHTGGRESLEIALYNLKTMPAPDPIESPAAAAVLIREPRTLTCPRRDRLQHFYDLTETEATIAAGLVGSGNVSAVAEKMQVQPNTIRVHLKKIFQKTGARCQSELVGLLTSNWLLIVP